MSKEPPPLEINPQLSASTVIQNIKAFNSVDLKSKPQFISLLKIMLEGANENNKGWVFYSTGSNDEEKDIGFYQRTFPLDIEFLIVSREGINFAAVFVREKLKRLNP